MFHAYENSEEVDRMDVLRTLFDQPGLHSYPFVEVPLNCHLFHVDIAPVNDESRWQRFIFDKVENILEFATAEKIQEFRIHFQSRRERGEDYQLKRVVGISKGRAITGESVYVFSCSDGSTELGGFNELSLNDIEEVSNLWEEPQINE